MFLDKEIFFTSIPFLSIVIQQKPPYVDVKKSCQPPLILESILSIQYALLMTCFKLILSKKILSNPDTIATVKADDPPRPEPRLNS